MTLYLMGVLCDPKQPLETGTVGEDSSALRVSFGINQVVWEMIASPQVSNTAFLEAIPQTLDIQTPPEKIFGPPKPTQEVLGCPGEGFLNYTEIWSASLSGLTLSRFWRAAGFLRPYLRLSSYSVHRAAKDGMVELELPLRTMTMRYVCRMCTCMYIYIYIYLHTYNI